MPDHHDTRAVFETRHLTLREVVMGIPFFIGYIIGCFFFGYFVLSRLLDCP